MSSNPVQGSEKTELSELLKQLDTTITNLINKRHHLNEQLIHHDTGKRLIKSLNESNNGGVASGKPANEKISRLERLIKEFDVKIEQAKSTKVNLVKLGELQQLQSGKPQESVNEEGLPFMDIQEEVDEEGNIISTKINDVPFEVAGKTGTVKKLQNQTKNKQLENEKFEDEVKQLLQDMELVSTSHNHRVTNVDQDDLLSKIDNLHINPQDKFDLKRLCIDAFNTYNEDEDEGEGENEDKDKDEDDVDEDAALGEKKSSKKSKDSFSLSSLPINSIDKSDLLELEILADDFDDQDVCPQFNEDEELNYDYEDEDEDEEEDNDDDASADDIIYGNTRDNSWFGGEQQGQANSLLWGQINKLRLEKVEKYHKHVSTDTEEEGVTRVEPKKKQKSVRFAEHLSIKRVENISESLKNPPSTHRKQSLFKQRKSGSAKVSTESMDENNNNTNFERGKQERAIEDTIVERDDESLAGMQKKLNQTGAASINKEQSFANSQQTIIKKSVSKFKAMRNKTQDPKENVDQRNSSLEVEARDDEKDEKDEKDDESDNNQEVRDTRLDYHNLSKDLDTMAKAYVLGMYDDDIRTEGPVVEKIEDFETLNKVVVESQSTAKNQPDTIDDLNEIGMDYNDADNIDIDEEEDNGPIMSDYIIENDFDEGEQEEEEEDDDDDDNESKDFYEDEMHNQEIKENYYRLRQKMIMNQNGYKKQAVESMEFIPIDEEGNNVKVSRFKAGRLRLE
ncbi:hypothetical protein KGF56_003047 [Candida oxycetoniae]|uniref:DUF3835 domain-containing protein n=1 Tax=Candida oxycetoniae TaxID=497107 RepID=A0AAI9SWN1_9ASCO|nr:uncharacterized protein KGF56_003047 [Candida oxycetoniae]KAI3404147.2 hypothetical protein KGF56_003047 [Candida oxycetoniae]